jgi:hypothetical protein
MDIIKELDKKIERKKQELFDLERQLGEGRAYLSALEDARKLLPKEAGSRQDFALRLGSDLANVQDALRKEGKPLHIEDLLQKIGKPSDKKHKISLSGSLASYVRDGRIFTRPAPNTFGLLEFADGELMKLNNEGPPEDFGKQ